MSAPAPNAILDKIDSSPMGMNSGLPPHMLSSGQLAFGCNITCRGGHPRTRPAIRKLAMTYTADESHPDVATEATENLFQGAAFYRGLEGNPNSLIASIGGRIFRYRISNSDVQVQEFTPLIGAGPTLDINDPTRDEAWLWQAEDFMIINDGYGRPFIFDGASVRRSANDELPAGTAGQYVNGRIVMALPDRRSYIAGNLVYTGNLAGPYGGRESILKITDNIEILGGAAFAIPVNAGPITAMFVVAIPDTSLGQGALHIGTRNAVFSVNLPLDATLWTSLQQPTQVVSLPNCPGPTSFFGVSQVNGDAWYRSTDGLRSFAVARKDFNTWVQTPLSFEMEAILPNDTEYLLGHSSVVRFDNRLLSTCSPYRVRTRGTAHRGLVALDFNNISSITTRSQPAYDGLWTGLPILQIVTGEFDGVERCFAFALDAENKICLFEILRDGLAQFDWDGSADVMIESWIASNALFGREELPERVQAPLKKLITADMWFEQLAGDIDFVVQYRPDAYPFWQDWKTFEICAPATDCTTSDCPTFADVQQQYATFVRLPEPQDTCNTVTKQLFRSGYYFQMRIQWTGHAELHKVLSWATPLPETIPNCVPSSECVLLAGCTEDYFTYTIES